MTAPDSPPPPGGPGRQSTLPTNGGYLYGSRQEEYPIEREMRERYWRSLGRRIRAGARIR